MGPGFRLAEPSAGSVRITPGASGAVRRVFFTPFAVRAIPETFCGFSVDVQGNDGDCPQKYFRARSFRLAAGPGQIGAGAGNFITAADGLPTLHPLPLPHKRQPGTK